MKDFITEALSDATSPHIYCLSTVPWVIKALQCPTPSSKGTEKICGEEKRTKNQISKLKVIPIKVR